MATKRAEMAALMDSMREEENTSMRDAAELFRSEDMKAFTDQITAFRDKTIPGGVFDQVLSSLLSVHGSAKELLDNKFPAANEAVVENVVEAPAQTEAE